ncbi:MAG: hypothetical protein CMH93_00300 [Oceanicaulis sp.]|nr:hypothetical protein [Oceanicaulis sp.]
MNRSYIAALAIFVAVVLLFTVGTLLNGGAASPDAEQAETSHRFEVVVRTVEARMRPASLSLRGHTEAFREVVARAETGGRVAEAQRLEGTRVAAGDVLCRLDVDSRSAAVQQAEADLRARQLEYDAAAELSERGHRSANQVAAAEAARDAARARLSAAREELANVNIAAPFDGIFDGRAAEVGDFLRAGDACGTVVQLDPILVVAEVGERHVAELEPGMAGSARLVTGQTVDGTIRFVERRADPAPAPSASNWKRPIPITPSAQVSRRKSVSTCPRNRPIASRPPSSRSMPKAYWACGSSRRAIASASCRWSCSAMMASRSGSPACRAAPR